MARPRKFYPVFEMGRVIRIAEGRKAAHRYVMNGFRTRLSAEEFSAWWNYQQAEREAAITTEFHARLKAKGIDPLSLG